MTLLEGIYDIPDDCTVYIQKRKVIIQKKKLRGASQHCRDCIHQIMGRKTLLAQYYTSPYCELKPKVIHGRAGYFYNAQDTKKACEKFEPKQRP